MKPPVIYLNCHDVGRLIQPYGHAVPTPHLQRFAEQAVFFRNAHTVAPTCSPSRAGLLTGRYPHQVGMLGLAHRGFELNDYSQHLARRLSAEGYLTALSGLEHVGAMESEQGAAFYDEHLSKDCRAPKVTFEGKDECCARQAARFIKEHAEEARPFYLECGLFYPHRPYPRVSAETVPGEARVPAYLPDTPQVREDMRAYTEAMRVADKNLGIIFEVLRGTGLDKRAIIIVTTDHGPAFPWAKCNLNDQGTGVMLMMRLPEMKHAVQVEAMVSQLDILPTIYDVLALPKDERFEGVSLLPLITGKREHAHEEIFSEVTYHAAYEPMRSVRTDRYRYVRRFAENWGHPVMPNIDDGPSRRSLMSSGVRDMQLEAEALYDLHFDPMERRNLVADPMHAAVLRDMRARLENWMIRTGDPLLKGPVAIPEGATVTPHTALDLT
jgi:N-sulfoglucosamine sulfohydrolase